MRLHLTATSVSLVMMFAGPAPAQETGNVAEGYNLARQVCAECHAVENGYLVSQNPDATPFEIMANNPAMTPLALSVWFRSTHPSMPNLILSEREKANAAAYIRSLAND